MGKFHNTNAPHSLRLDNPSGCVVYVSGKCKRIYTDYDQHLKEDHFLVDAWKGPHYTVGATKGPYSSRFSESLAAVLKAAISDRNPLHALARAHDSMTLEIDGTDDYAG